MQIDVPELWPRNLSRKDLAVPESIRRINDDLDSHERQLAGLRLDLRAEIQALKDELKNTNRILLGLLITIVSACMVGLMNLIFGLAR